MSVTLKLADEDAAVVGSILRAVAQVPHAPDYETWFRNVRASHTGRTTDKLLEISGAFRVAVRANER